MYIIGLTGGVGSGKSYIANLAVKSFRLLHVNTDDIAREQMKKGGISYGRVVKEFGSSVLKADGEIDRTRLAGLIFDDDRKRQRLNELTHPAVGEYIRNLIAAEEKADRYPAMIIETAILKEAGYISICDEIWYVSSPEPDRRERLLESRGYSNERIDSMFENQLKQEDFLKFADIVIDNHTGISDGELIEQLRKSKVLTEWRQ